MQKEYDNLNKWFRAILSGPAEKSGQWLPGAKHLADLCGMKAFLRTLKNINRKIQ